MSRVEAINTLAANIEISINQYINIGGTVEDAARLFTALALDAYVDSVGECECVDRLMVVANELHEGA